MAIKIKKKGERPEEPAQDEVIDMEPVAPAADPFARATVGGASWIEEHRGLVLGGIAAVFVIILAGYFGLEYLESQKVDASAALSPALENYHTIVEGSPEYEAVQANDKITLERTFPSVEAKWQAVYDAAAEALSQYDTGQVAQSARLTKAAAALRLGKNEEALELYEAYLAKPHPDAGVFAVYNGMATAYAAQQKWDQAAQTFDELAEADEAYAGLARYQKARVLEEAGKPEEAKALYHEILEADPSTPFKNDIERRLALL